MHCIVFRGVVTKNAFVYNTESSPPCVGASVTLSRGGEVVLIGVVEDLRWVIELNTDLPTVIVSVQEKQ